MNYNFASATILLILITDPFGNIPIFANALKNVAPLRRPLVIVREALIAFALLLAFMFMGDGFLRVMNLSALSLQIAGGVILFLIALRMIFPPPAADESADPQGEPLIVPLAIPAIAGPSALATVMLLVSQAPGRRWEWIAALSVGHGGVRRGAVAGRAHSARAGRAFHHRRGAADGFNSGRGVGGAAAARVQDICAAGGARVRMVGWPLMLDRNFFVNAI